MQQRDQRRGARSRAQVERDGVACGRRRDVENGRRGCDERAARRVGHVDDVAIAHDADRSAVDEGRRGRQRRRQLVGLGAVSTALVGRWWDGTQRWRRPGDGQAIDQGLDVRYGRVDEGEWCCAVEVGGLPPKGEASTSVVWMGCRRLPKASIELASGVSPLTSMPCRACGAPGEVTSRLGSECPERPGKVRVLAASPPASMMAVSTGVGSVLDRSASVWARRSWP